VVGTGTKTVRWALTTAQNRPYAFIRNLVQMSDHSPRSVAGTTYSPNCNMRTTPCSQGSRTYSVGGTY
jgi:hypothetical protein